MTTTIRNIRAVGVADDPLFTRLRLERALGAADLQVPGMPPAAILCVRRLPDPLPGRLDLDALIPARAWEQAMRAALGRMAQQAARPALCAPPPNAQAVWFADRAELLACLARDWCAGMLAERWWWRTLLCDRAAVNDLTGRLYAAWRATPEAIPSALALLHDSGDGARFLAWLPSAEVQALTRSVAATFGLPALESMRAVPPDQQEHVVSPAGAADLAMLDRAASVRALGSERRALYAAGVLLACAPMLARAAWPVALMRWAAAADLGSAASYAQMQPEAPAVVAPLPVPSATLHQDVAEPLRVQWPNGPHDHVASVAAAPTTQPNATAPTATLPDVGSPAPHAAAPDAAPMWLLAPRGGGPRSGEPVVTQFGGVLFLINLALRLDLYADFTRPLHAGLGLSPWALLEQLGPHLLLAATPSDPLWAMLTKLAGAAPGAGFSPPRRWRVPHAWLAPFGTPTPYQIVYHAGWLQVAHPAGFVVLERRRSRSRRHDRFSQSHSVVDRPASIARRAWRCGARALSFTDPPDTQAGWIARLAGYARARLALALGGANEVARALALPARIYAGDVRVDVMFPLNELPIAVRLAGLDRDPGWVPAAGRDIRFHFE